MKYFRPLFISVLLAFSISAMSQTSKIRQLEIQKKKALQEIENTNKLLIDTKRVTQNLATRIKLIANQIDSRKRMMSLLEEESEALTVQQGLTQQEIIVLENELKKKQDNYAKAVRGMIYRKQSENKLLYVLSGKSLAESMRRMRYLREYSEWRSKEADEIKAKADELRQKRADLQQQHKSKVLLINQKGVEQQTLKKEEEIHKQEISEAHQKQQELQTIIAQKRKQANELNAQIERLIAEEVARQEREEKRRAAERQRKVEEQEKARRLAKEQGKARRKKAENGKSTPTEVLPERHDVTPERPRKESEPIFREESSANLILSNSFASNKGRLPVPVTGRYSIVSGFGVHQQSQYVTTNSNGIDIQTQAGSDARAAFNGEVTKVVPFPGYNNCIIVRHGNYYTFYGNIQNVSVQMGQHVRTGQNLGRIFTDPDTGVTKMHFQLWNGTSKQNPISWLRR